MQAIRTYYLPPTNHRPGRIKAVAQAGSVVLSWDNALDADANHAAAAKALRDKFNWTGVYYGDLVAAWLPDCSAVWVFVNKNTPRIDAGNEPEPR